MLLTIVDIHSIPQGDNEYYNDDYNDEYYYDGVVYSVMNGTDGNATDKVCNY